MASFGAPPAAPERTAEGLARVVELPRLGLGHGGVGQDLDPRGDGGECVGEAQGRVEIARPREQVAELDEWQDGLDALVVGLKCDQLQRGERGVLGRVGVPGLELGPGDGRHDVGPRLFGEEGLAAVGGLRLADRAIRGLIGAETGLPSASLRKVLNRFDGRSKSALRTSW